MLFYIVASNLPSLWPCYHHYHYGLDVINSATCLTITVKSTVNLTTATMDESSTPIPTFKCIAFAIIQYVTIVDAVPTCHRITKAHSYILAHDGGDRKKRIAV